MSGNRVHGSATAWAAVLVLAVSACTGGSADTTTTSAPTTSSTTSTSSTTTTTTTPLIANGPAIVFEGDRNETVEAFQFLINCNGFAELTVDGAFGPATLTGIEATQQALGREVTGAPDDETLGLLSRGCSEDRRVEIDESDEGDQIVVGNVAANDPDIYFIRVDDGLRFSVVVTSETGAVVASVREVDGTTIGPSGVRAWAEDIEESADHVVEISTTGEPITYVATFAEAELELEDVAAADEDTMVLDEFEETITGVCLDTNGDASYVAETGPGHLIVTTGAVGTFGIDRGGVGATVEFVFKDESAGYLGFPLDFDIEVGERVEGQGHVFQVGAFDEPLPLAFDFARSAAPCEGGSGITIVLSHQGLGVVDFGAGDDETLGFVRSALPGASPTVDSGWIPVDNQNNEYGICRDGTTEVRVIEVDNLTLYFTSAGTSFASAGTRHFAAFRADDGVFPFATAQGIGPGSTLGEVLAAHPAAVASDGLDGGIDVFITSPPGDDRWLRATAADAAGADDVDAVITSVTGGRFCDL